MGVPCVVVHWLTLLTVASCGGISSLPPNSYTASSNLLASLNSIKVTSRSPPISPDADPNLLKLLNGTKGTRTQLCSNKPCIRKCCRFFEIVVMETTASNSGYCKSRKILDVFNFTEFTTAKVKYENAQLVEVSSEFVPIVDFKMIFDSNRTNILLADFYLDKSGKLMFKKPNYWKRWSIVDTEHYCLDYVKMQSDEIVVRPFKWDEFPPVERNWIVTRVAMLISSAFLVATLAVYSYVPLLRNLHGKVLMAYAASLLGFFLSFSITQWITSTGNKNGQRFILTMAVPIYYFLMATLFWMNIMSFDIWYKFRGIVRAKTINRRGELHKFKMYCLYGFGCPLLMSIVFGVLAFVPEDILGDDIVTPGIAERGVFIGDDERTPFIYIPMSIITVVNVGLFVATVLNIYKLKRDARSIQNVNYAENSRKQFYLYCKIFSLMGVSWILDFVATTSPGSEIWCVVDVFNFLLGVFIFFIFVGKRRILGMITTRHQERRGTLPSVCRRRQNSSSVTGRESEHSNSTCDEDFMHLPVFSSKKLQFDAPPICSQTEPTR